MTKLTIEEAALIAGCYTYTDRGRVLDEMALDMQGMVEEDLMAFMTGLYKKLSGMSDEEYAQNDVGAYAETDEHD